MGEDLLVVGAAQLLPQLVDDLLGRLARLVAAGVGGGLGVLAGGVPGGGVTVAVRGQGDLQVGQLRKLVAERMAAALIPGF